MADHHAFRLAGGTGGVDRVAETVGRLRQVRVFRRVAVHQSLQVIEQQALQPIRLRQARQHALLAEQQAQSAVVDHVLQAVRGILRIQRHIGATRLEHRQQGHHHGYAALQRDTDQYIAADTLLAQTPGEAVGQRIEFGVAQAFLAEQQGRRVRGQPGLGLEQAMHTLPGGIFARRQTAALQQRGALLGVEQRQVAEASSRLGDDGL